MGEEGRAKIGQMGLPALEPGKIVRIPLAGLHEFLVANGLEIVGKLVAPGDPHRLVVELAPMGPSTAAAASAQDDGGDSSGCGPQNDRMRFSE